MSLLAEIALVVVAGLAVAACVARLPDSSDRGLPRSPLPVPDRPEQLVSLERLVSMSEVSALTAHAYLRPVLAEVAGRRLAARGYSLDRLSDSAGIELLGERLWDLVRPGRPFPEDRHGRGIPGRELDEMIALLEAL